MCISCAVARLARGEGADYKGRANSFKRSVDDRSVPQRKPRTAPRREMVAAVDRCADRDHGAGRRRHAADRVGAFDRRVEAGHRHAAAAQPGAMDRCLRGLQEDSAISRTQCRHVARPVQDHLLVGMEPPAARARDRGGLSAAVPLVPVARRLERGAEAAAVADLRPRRAAGRGRLVDGGLGPDAADRGFAISPRHPSGAGAADLRRHRLDAAAAVGPAAS